MLLHFIYRIVLLHFIYKIVACIEDGNFCHECGNPLDSNIRAENNTDNIIEGYFYRVVIPIVM